MTVLYTSTHTTPPTPHSLSRLLTPSVACVTDLYGHQVRVVVMLAHVTPSVLSGLQQLVARVRQATETVLISYSLKHQLTAEGVTRLLTDIRSLSASQRRPSAG